MKRVCFRFFNLSICAASMGIFPSLQPHRPPRTHVCICCALVSAESMAWHIPMAPHLCHISVSKSSCMSLISSVGFLNPSTLMGNFCLPPRQMDSVCCLWKLPGRNREVRGTILPDLGQGKSLKPQTVTEKKGNPVSPKDCKNWAYLSMQNLTIYPQCTCIYSFTNDSNYNYSSIIIVYYYKNTLCTWWNT